MWPWGKDGDGERDRDRGTFLVLLLGADGMVSDTSPLSQLIPSPSQTNHVPQATSNNLIPQVLLFSCRCPQGQRELGGGPAPIVMSCMPLCCLAPLVHTLQHRGAAPSTPWILWVRVLLPITAPWVAKPAAKASSAPSLSPACTILPVEPYRALPRARLSPLWGAE